MEYFSLSSTTIQVSDARKTAYCELGDLMAGAIRVTVPPARPPEIAEQEEFDAACVAGTAAALQLFIERHPQSKWRAEAEVRLRNIVQKAPKPTY